MLKVFKVTLLQIRCADLTAGQPILFEPVNRKPLISHMQNKVSIVPKLWCADYMTLSTLELLQ